MLSADSSLENFSFLYGTFPTASGVFSYAADYQIALNIIGTSYMNTIITLKHISTEKLRGKNYQEIVQKSRCVNDDINADFLFLISLRISPKST
jgi:hypothetical protein